MLLDRARHAVAASRQRREKPAIEQAVIALARSGAKDAGKDVIENELRKLLPGVPFPKKP